MPTKKVRKGTINMRTTEQEKLFLQSAAELAGFSNLTNFVMTAARQEAARILSDSHTSYVSAKDWELVNNLIENPPKPNKPLKALLKKCKTKESVNPC